MATERVRVVQVLEAVVGGTKKHVLDLCRNLDPERFELHALLSPLRDPEPAATRALLEQAGVRVLDIPMRRGPAPLSDIRAGRSIEDCLRRVRPHIVHAHSAKAGLIGRLAAGRAGVPAVVYTPHSFPFTMAVPLLMRETYLRLERLLARHTDRIICVCESERETALRARVALPERLVVIENGIRVTPPAAVDRARELQSLGLPADARVILCVGDLRAQKGHEFALRAMAAVLRQEPRARLLIAGEGPLRARLRRMAAPLGERVRLLGHRDDVPELLACCDIFCQPSLWEGCPYALIEAAAAGCTLVGSAIPGVVDIIEDGVTGLLAQAGSAKDLARALVDALNREDARGEWGRAAQALVMQRHTLGRMVNLTADLYEALAAGADGAGSV